MFVVAEQAGQDTTVEHVRKYVYAMYVCACVRNPIFLKPHYNKATGVLGDLFQAKYLSCIRILLDTTFFQMQILCSDLYSELYFITSDYSIPEKICTPSDFFENWHTCWVYREITPDQNLTLF